MAYTIEDLTSARDALRRETQRWESYSGNNPDKFRTQIRDAKLKVELIEAELKRSGVLAKTTEELQAEALDRQFPKARSKDVVVWEGRRFQLRFRPAEKSRSGKTVTAWHRDWVRLDD